MCPANPDDGARDHPRQRLVARGARALADRELLALVLRDGTREASALELADSLLKEHGGLCGIAHAFPEELLRSHGVGPAKAAALVAAFQLSRQSANTQSSLVLRAPADVAMVVRWELTDLRRERVIVVVCDSGNRVRRLVTVAEGSMDRCSLPIRETLNAVLRHDGRAFAVAHNHPSGTPEPSSADNESTRSLEAAARTVGLRLLDHLVVAQGGWRRALASAQSGVESR